MIKIDKAHKLKYWVDSPSTRTALSAKNLNELDISVNTIDDRVINLDGTKLDKTTGNLMVLDVSVDTKKGIITVKKLNGGLQTFDLNIEKVVVNFKLNDSNQLVLTAGDGTEQIVDLSRFIDTYTFSDTGTVAFTNDNKKISATVKKGSITGEELRPDYLADITKQTEYAKNYSESAKEVVDEIRKELEDGDLIGPPSITIQGREYAFYIKNGHLMLVYNDGYTQPDFRINDEGHLIFNLKGAGE